MPALFIMLSYAGSFCSGLWPLPASHRAPHCICRFFLLRRASRPAVLQNIIDMRKRLKGAPTTGMVSVVVTDIEDFSGAVSGWTSQVQWVDGPLSCIGWVDRWTP